MRFAEGVVPNIQAKSQLLKGFANVHIFVTNNVLSKSTKRTLKLVFLSNAKSANRRLP